MRQAEIVEALITAQGRLYSEDIGANIARNTPQPLFHWLLGALLMSARIGAESAVRAAAALKTEGLHKVDAILTSRRDRRIQVLNENGYARFDNKGADQILAAAQLAQSRYGGDLRNLRRAGADAAGIRRRLTEFTGIGDTGADIFCREVQLVWDELYPRADRICLDAAAQLGLPDDVGGLVRISGGRERFVRLLSALTRASLDGPAAAVSNAAGLRGRMQEGM